MKKSSSASSLAKIIAYALIGAIAFVIMKLAFPLPIASFLKFDFSDVVIAVGTFLFGPAAGIFVAFIRMLISLIFSGFALPSLIGQLSAFLATLSFSLPFYYVTKSVKKDDSATKRHLMPLVGLLLGVAAMTVVLATFNAFILTPVYAVTSIPNPPAIGSYTGLLQFTEKQYLGQLLHIPSMGSYIFGIIVPFNLAKGLINGAVVYVLFEAVLKSMKPFVAKHFDIKG